MSKNDEAKYKVAKILIEHQQIRIFSDIFDHVPKSIVARELHTNSNRFTRLIEDPLEFQLSDLKVIAKLIKVDVKQIINLVLNQEKTNRNDKKAGETKSPKINPTRPGKTN